MVDLDDESGGGEQIADVRDARAVGPGPQGRRDLRSGTGSGFVVAGSSVPIVAHRNKLVNNNYQGLPFADVADRLGRSQDSVKKLWARALGRLRVLMEDDEG